jgi:2-polyprenyl-3-methyl-5-hydroxy-6-metoxy-1,4-benzoquinol methylase
MSSRDWESLAQTDPLFAVLTDARYQREMLTPETENEFWSSGEVYVQRIAGEIQRVFGVRLAPDSALDFGCGVGRLLMPIARISRAALGLDASPTMLTLAENACARAGLANVRLASSLSEGDSFDFVNSALVFQHIPVRQGLEILETVLRLVRPQGLIAIEFLVARADTSVARRIGRWLRSNFKTMNSLVNRVQGRAASTPYMQMNAYPLDRVLELFSANDVRERVILTRVSDGFESALILGRRS